MMFEVIVGLAIGLCLGALACRIAYVYGRYRGYNEVRWAGYNFEARRRKETEE